MQQLLDRFSVLETTVVELQAAVAHDRFRADARASADFAGPRPHAGRDDDEFSTPRNRPGDVRRDRFTGTGYVAHIRSEPVTRDKLLLAGIDKLTTHKDWQPLTSQVRLMMDPTYPFIGAWISEMRKITDVPTLSLMKEIGERIDAGASSGYAGFLEDLWVLLAIKVRGVGSSIIDHTADSTQARTRSFCVQPWRGMNWSGSVGARAQIAASTCLELCISQSA